MTRLFLREVLPDAPSYYLPSTVRGGVSNTICLRVCLRVFPQNRQLLENRSLVPRPGPTPGRLRGRKDGCRQPSPELRAVRQAGSISRPGEPSTQHPRIHRRPRLPRGGRTCPGVGGSPNQQVGDSREALQALHSLWSSSRRGSGNRGTEQSLQASGRPVSARPSPCDPPPLVSPPENLSEFQWLGMEQGGRGLARRRRQEAEESRRPLSPPPSPLRREEIEP